MADMFTSQYVLHVLVTSTAKQQNAAGSHDKNIKIRKENLRPTEACVVLYQKKNFTIHNNTIKVRTEKKKKISGRYSCE